MNPELFVQVNTRSPKARVQPIGYIMRSNGCWDWVGTKHPGGYGQFRRHGRMQRAHRVLYEDIVGKIPDGLTLDHLCRNRGCVNPAHMEPVTRRENILRGDGAGVRGSRRTHCPRGHALGGDNLVRCELKRGKRKCRTCDNDWERRKPSRRPT